MKFGSDISSGIANVTHGISYAISGFVQFLESLPGDIMSALQNLGLALWHALQSMGGFFYAGFRDIASAVIGGLNEIRKGFTYVGEAFIDFADTLRQDLVNFGNVVLQALAVVGQFFVDVWNDLKQIGEIIWNALVAVWNGLVAFGNDVVSGIINAFNLVGNILNIPSLVSDIPNLVTGLLKQEASRLAGAFPRVVGFNVALESMKGKVKKGNLGFKDAFLLPVKSAILGLVTEAIMQSFYPEITSVSQYTYNTSKTPPSITPPSVTPTSHQPMSSQSASQTALGTIPTVPPPTPFSTRQPMVVGVRVVDEICEGQSSTCLVTSGTVLGNVGGYGVGEWIQTFSDTFGISASLLLALMQTMGVTVEDQFSPTVEAQSQFQGFAPEDYVTLNATGTVSVLSLPSPLQFCVSSYQPASTVVSDETATDQLSVYVQECVPLYNIAIDNFYANGTSTSELLTPTYSDSFTFNGTSTIPSSVFISVSYTGSTSVSTEAS